MGLALDVERGTLTAYKNGHRLGVLSTGLRLDEHQRGFVWAVDMCRAGDSVTMSAAPPPLP